eukprot:4317432-Prymnesium_polylepis.1
MSPRSTRKLSSTTSAQIFPSDDADDLLVPPRDVVQLAAQNEKACEQREHSDWHEGCLPGGLSIRDLRGTAHAERRKAVS